MDIEEFKKNIEEKFENQITGLKQQIKNRDYTIQVLNEKIDLLIKTGASLYNNSRDFRKKLECFYEDEMWQLPFGGSFDDAARLFKICESDD